MACCMGSDCRMCSGAEDVALLPGWRGRVRQAEVAYNVHVAQEERSTIAVMALRGQYPQHVEEAECDRIEAGIGQLFSVMASWAWIARPARPATLPHIPADLPL